MIEYLRQPEDHDESDCPALEVNMIVESIAQHQRSLQCTDDELKRARKHQNDYEWTLHSQSDEKQLDIVLNSGLEV